MLLLPLLYTHNNKTRFCIPSYHHGLLHVVDESTFLTQVGSSYCYVTLAASCWSTCSRFGYSFLRLTRVSSSSTPAFFYFIDIDYTAGVATLCPLFVSDEFFLFCFVYLLLSISFLELRSLHSENSQVMLVFI